MKYLMEPMLFAFDQGLSEQELNNYIDELIALDEWWDQHREDMFIQDSTSEVLYNNSYYPTGDSLKPLLEKYRINHIQYGDVERIIVKMLNKSKMIESLFDEPLMDMKSQTVKQPVNMQPNVKRPEQLHNELLGLLWNVFLAHEMGGHDEKSFVVITKGISDIVSVEYEYEEYEEADGDIIINERKGTSEVNCKGSLDDFLKDDATPFLVWKTAERKDDLDLGIRIALFQSNGEPNMANVYKNYKFIIQNSFYDDFCEGHYQSKDSDIRSTIQAVTDAVLENNLQKMHAIRIGKHGNDPQLTKNGYNAQRRDITTSIKLAYWKKGREFKIANMKEHDFVECSWES